MFIFFPSGRALPKIFYGPLIFLCKLRITTLIILVEKYRVLFEMAKCLLRHLKTFQNYLTNVIRDYSAFHYLFRPSDSPQMGSKRSIFIAQAEFK